MHIYTQRQQTRWNSCHFFKRESTASIWCLAYLQDSTESSFVLAETLKKKTSCALMCSNNLLRTAAIRHETLIFNVWQAAFWAACPLMGNNLKLARYWWRSDNCAVMKSSKRTDLWTTSWQFKSEHKLGEIQNNKPKLTIPQIKIQHLQNNNHILCMEMVLHWNRNTKNHQIIIFLSN